MTQLQEEQRQGKSRLSSRLGQGETGGPYSSSPASWTVEQFAQLEPKQFGREVQKRWQAAEKIVQAVIEVVEQDLLSIPEALGIIGCAVAQPFGYSAFHGGQPYTPFQAPLDMAATLGMQTK